MSDPWQEDVEAEDDWEEELAGAPDRGLFDANEDVEGEAGEDEELGLWDDEPAASGSFGDED